MDTGTIIKYLPILIFVVLSAIVIGLIFLLSRKKKPANQFVLMPITPIDKDIKVEPIEEKKEEEKVQEIEEVKQEVIEEVKEEPKEEIKIEEKKDEVVPSLINIPINNMDDTPIVIEEAKALNEVNEDEMIKIEGSTPINEVKEEVIKTEENTIIEPQVEEVKTEYVQTEPVVTQTELIQSEEPKEVIMTNDAFSQLPDDNHDINTNFKVEEKRDYVGNKTEILDVEEIKRAMVNKE